MSLTCFRNHGTINEHTMAPNIPHDGDQLASTTRKPKPAKRPKPSKRRKSK